MQLHRQMTKNSEGMDAKTFSSEKRKNILSQDLENKKDKYKCQKSPWKSIAVLNLIPNGKTKSFNFVEHFL